MEDENSFLLQHGRWKQFLRWEMLNMWERDKIKLFPWVSLKCQQNTFPGGKLSPTLAQKAVLIRRWCRGRQIVIIAKSSAETIKLRTKEKNSNFMHLIQPSSIYICRAKETNASYDKLIQPTSRTLTSFFRYTCLTKPLRTIKSKTTWQSTKKFILITIYIHTHIIPIKMKSERNTNL